MAIGGEELCKSAWKRWRRLAWSMRVWPSFLVFIGGKAAETGEMAWPGPHRLALNPFTFVPTLSQWPHLQ